MDMKFCHTSYSPELTIYEKNMAFERDLKSAQNTYMRNKSVVVGIECIILASTSVYLDTNKLSEPPTPNRNVDDP